MRLRFSKTGQLRFIGHLDFLKVFQQTLRRAGLPMAYSQGFNPHMQLSFALPVPLGMASINDYADISLESAMPADEICQRFNEYAPAGLYMSIAWEVTGPGAAALVTAADYDLYEPLGVNESAANEIIQSLLSRDSIVIPKKIKSGVKDTDIRPDILDLSVVAAVTDACDDITQKNENEYEKKQKPCISMRLSAGSGRFLNPLIVAKLLTERDIAPSQLSRLELYLGCEEKGFVSMAYGSTKM